MRYGILVTLVVAVVGLIPYAQQQDKKPDVTDGGTTLWTANSTASSFQPICSLTLTGKEKSATIDFCGDKVAYSGDLPVADAAKVFFDAVLIDDKSRCEKRANSKPSVKLIPPISWRAPEPVASIEEPK